jgi:hypothetical protein
MSCACYLCPSALSEQFALNSNRMTDSLSGSTEMLMSDLTCGATDWISSGSFCVPLTEVDSDLYKCAEVCATPSNQSDSTSHITLSIRLHSFSFFRPHLALLDRPCSRIFIQTDIQLRAAPTNTFCSALQERNADRIAGCHNREGLLERMLLLQRRKLSCAWKTLFGALFSRYDQDILVMPGYSFPEKQCPTYSRVYAAEGFIPQPICRPFEVHARPPTLI